MNLKAKLAFALIVLPLFLTVPAKAMTLDDFARMNDDDEAGYVAFMVEAASQYLKTQGHPDQADKIVTLFSTPGKDGGVQQLGATLKRLNALNKHNAINPNNRVTPSQAEDAMSLTLKDDGINVPAGYLLTAGKDFRPSGVPRKHAYGL